MASTNLFAKIILSLQDQASVGLKNVEGRIAALKGRLLKLGVIGAGALGLSALAGKFDDIVAAGEKLDEQQRRIQGVIEATGGAAGLTTADIVEMSHSFDENAGAARDAAAKLLTFKSVTGDTFKEALNLANDMEAAGFGNLEENAVMLGKALQDPINGLTALRRAGVTFTESERAVIKSFAETSDIAKAQGEILKAIAGQFGRVDAAIDKGLQGSRDQVDALGTQIEEKLGGAAVDALIDLNHAVADLYRGLLDSGAVDAAAGLIKGSITRVRVLFLELRRDAELMGEVIRHNFSFESFDTLRSKMIAINAEYAEQINKVQQSSEKQKERNAEVGKSQMLEQQLRDEVKKRAQLEDDLAVESKNHAKQRAADQVEASKRVISALEQEVKKSADEYDKLDQKITQLKQKQSSDQQSYQDKIRNINRSALQEEQRAAEQAGDFETAQIDARILHADSTQQAKDAIMAAQQQLIKGNADEARSMADRAVAFADELSNRQEQIDFIQQAAEISRQATQQEITDAEQQKKTESEVSQSLSKQLETQKATLAELEKKAEALKVPVEMKIKADISEADANIAKLTKELQAAGIKPAQAANEPTQAPEAPQAAAPIANQPAAQDLQAVAATDPNMAAWLAATQQQPASSPAQPSQTAAPAQQLQQPVQPQIDTAQVDAAKQKVVDLQAALTGLAAQPIIIAVDTTAIDTASQKVAALQQQVNQLNASIAQSGGDVASQLNRAALAGGG